MDIQIIEENITELENGDTTFETVQELAYLYIVRDKLVGTDLVKKELSDILPAYQKYIIAKRKFQMKEIEDSQMIELFKLVCKEVQDFILLLYSGTSTRKERHYIEETVSYLFKRFS